MLSSMLLLFGLPCMLSVPCEDASDCNNLGICNFGRCFCFDGVLGENCEGKNLCHAEMLQTRNSKHLIYCNMGGDCVDIGHDIYECVCRPGFSGPFCEAFTCKSDAACNGRGQCNLDDSHTYHGHCNCFHGYSGRDCFHDTCAHGDINRDNQYLCNSGGDCVVLPNTPPRIGRVYGCECRRDFSGNYCEDFSCMKRCANEGTCNEETGVCTCKHESFKGRDCGIAECGYWGTDESSLCSSHGTCVSIGFKHTCRCSPSFTGSDCSSPLCDAGGECLNGGSCVPGVEQDEPSTCACLGAYEGPLCELCRYPNSERPTQPDSDVMMCVPDECMKGGFVCNGAGVCVDDNGAWGCSCNRNAIAVDGTCIPHDSDLNMCVITENGRLQTVCNDRGDCRYGMDKLWRCRCHFGSVRAKDGNCYAIGCVRNGVVCSGRGACMLNTMTGSYSCQCDGSYTGNGATCALKSGIVAVSVIIPLLVIGGVAGFLCWWFLCHKKGRGISSGRGGGSKPRRGKAVRLSDGDSLSVQSGISGFTSQL